MCGSSFWGEHRPTLSIRLSRLEKPQPTLSMGLFRPEKRRPTLSMGHFGLEKRRPTLSMGLLRLEKRRPTLSMGHFRLEKPRPTLSMGHFHGENVDLNSAGGPSVLSNASRSASPQFRKKNTFALVLRIPLHIERILLVNDCVIIPDFGGRPQNPGMCLPSRPKRNRF